MLNTNKARLQAKDGYLLVFRLQVGAINAPSVSAELSGETEEDIFFSQIPLTSEMCFLKKKS